MSLNSQLLPWHQTQWQQVQLQKNQERFPHAILLTGIDGIGKLHFAQLLVHSLLCLHPKEEGLPCGNCQSCSWLQSNTHPDYLHITSAEAKKPIKIDQIRKLNEDLTLSAHHNEGYKIAIIHPADALNTNAANAFLKTLEEPAERRLLILITHRSMALPATIRSRCSTIYFPAPDKSAALQWLGAHTNAGSLELLLKLTQMAPLKVLRWISEDELTFRNKLFRDWQQWLDGNLALTALSSKWSKESLFRILTHLFSWVTDMIKLTARETDIVNTDLLMPFQKVIQQYGNKKLFRFYEKLLHVKQGLESPNNLNEQFLLEDLLLTWSI